MCSPIFEPKNSSDKTTEPITMKFGMNDHFTNLNNIIEAFFQISPLSWVTRPWRGGPEGQNWPKFFFDISIFFDQNSWIDIFTNRIAPNYKKFERILVNFRIFLHTCQIWLPTPSMANSYFLKSLVSLPILPNIYYICLGSTRNVSATAGWILLTLS